MAGVVNLIQTFRKNPTIALRLRQACCTPGPYTRKISDEFIVCECAREHQGMRLIQPGLFFFQSNIIFCHSLICARLHPLVYSMGSSVGGLERLYHLFLPGCGQPVQGETPENLSILS